VRVKTSILVRMNAYGLSSLVFVEKSENRLHVVLHLSVPQIGNGKHFLELHRQSYIHHI
jgi:hypothetical protein